MRRCLVSLLLAAVALVPALAVTSPADAAPEAAAKRGFVRHELPDWVWFGPRSWSGGGGPYGITIRGTKGAKIDIGAGGLTCFPGSTWRQSYTSYLKSRRQLTRRLGWRITKASRVRQLGAGYPPQYVKQTLQVRKGNRKQGTLEFEYGYVTGSSCIQRSEENSARRAAWRRGHRKLVKRVAASIITKGNNQVPFRTR